MTTQSTEKRVQFTIAVPVEIVAKNTSQLASMFGRLQQSGAILYSTDGYGYQIRTDRLRLRDIRAVFQTALKETP